MSSFIDHEKKFIFVHTPRCAGSSITTALAPGLPEWSGAIDMEASQARLGRYHWPAFEIATRAPNFFKDYFTFAFVRNPWSRIASVYFYARSRAHHPFHQAATTLEFADFVRAHVKKEKRDMSFFVCSKKGKVIVDHVAIFENFANELAALSAKLGVPNEIPVINASKSKNVPYQSLYTPETHDLIALRYEQDIKTFGFEF
jgi:hypothetical protein